MNTPQPDDTIKSKSSIEKSSAQADSKHHERQADTLPQAEFNARKRIFNLYGEFGDSPR